MFIECEEGASACWYRLKSRNGQIHMTSETYASKSNCNRAAKKVAAKLGLKVKPLLPAKRK